MRLRGGIVLISIVALAAGCGDGHGGAHSGEHEAHERASDTDGPALSLNGDQKWVMDDHTRAMFATMVGRLEPDADEHESAAGLGSALQSDIDELIRGCTMTGEAHAQLHEFLVALIPAVEKLASAGSGGEIDTVKQLLDLYPRYFK